MSGNMKIFALAAVLAAVPGAAMAQYGCIPGYAPYGGVCRPIAPQGYGNPVSGAVSGEADGAASGYRAAGPVGAMVGGALGIAGGTLAGTGNMLTGGGAAPGCARGYHYYHGYCYPNR